MEREGTWSVRSVAQRIKAVHWSSWRILTLHLLIESGGLEALGAGVQPEEELLGTGAEAARLQQAGTSRGCVSEAGKESWHFEMR